MTRSEATPVAGESVAVFKTRDGGIRVGHWLLLPVLVLAAFLRTHEISTVGLQCDESFVQRMVEFRWGEMLERIARDTHPPLYFVMHKVWTQFFGDGILVGRLLSALLGISAVAGIYAFVREACLDEHQSNAERFREAELPALVAAAMLAATPLQIFWSLQIRMYSLAVALTAWSSYLLLRSWNRGGAWNWAAYTVSAVLLSYSHYFGLFVLVSQFLCSVVILGLRSGKPWFERIAPAGVSASVVWFAWQPWIASFLRQRDQVEQSFYLPAPSWKVLGTLSHELWIDFGGKSSHIVGLIIVQGLFIAVLLLLLRKRPGDFFIAVGATLPVAMAFGLSAISRSLLNGRYFLLTQVFWIATVAIVVCRLWWPARVVGIGLLAWGFWSTCEDHYLHRTANAQLPGLRAAVQRIDAARGDAPVIVSNPMLHSSAISYAVNPKGILLYQPPRGFPFFMCTAVIRDEEYLDQQGIADLDVDVLWTLDASSWLGSVPVTGNWKLVREEPFAEWYTGLVVRLYERTQPPQNIDRNAG